MLTITGIFGLGKKTPEYSSMALPAPSSIPLSTNYYFQVFYLTTPFPELPLVGPGPAEVPLEIIGAEFHRSDALSAAQPTVSQHWRNVRALIWKRSWPHPNLVHQLTPRSTDAVVFTPALWRWYHSHLHATWNANSCLNSATSQSTILNYSNTTKKRLFIDVLVSRRKPSSGLTSGASRQYVKACLIRDSVRSFPHLDSYCRSSWSILPPLWVCQLCLILDQSPWCSPSLSHDSH